MERYEVVIYKSAQADIRGAVKYISKTLQEPDTARSMALRFREAILSLSGMPERFSVVPDSSLASMGFRMMSVGNYLVFYIVRKHTKKVDVVRVLYGKRNWVELLTNKEPKH